MKPTRKSKRSTKCSPTGLSYAEGPKQFETVEEQAACRQGYRMADYLLRHDLLRHDFQKGLPKGMMTGEGILIILREKVESKEVSPEEAMNIIHQVQQAAQR